jgi:hypothetical protein
MTLLAAPQAKGERTVDHIIYICEVYNLMDLCKLTFVAPHADALTLLAAGLAQWVRYVCDRWQEMLLVCGRLSVAGHVRSTNHHSWCCIFAEEACKKKFTLQCSER